MLIEFAIILGLVLLNGLLAGAEIAIVSVSPTRLKLLREQGGRRAQAVEQLRAYPERFPGARHDHPDAALPRSCRGLALASMQKKLPEGEILRRS